MKKVFICLGFFLSFNLFVWFLNIIKKRPVSDHYIIEKKYINSEVYRVNDLIVDNKLYNDLFSSKLYTRLFSFNLSIFLFFRQLYNISCAFSTLYYSSLSFVMFLKPRNFTDIQLYECDYKVKNYVNLYHLFLFFLKKSKINGFLINYNIIKYLKGDLAVKPSLHVILHTLIFRLFFGISSYNLLILSKITRDCVYYIETYGFMSWLKIYPRIIIYNFTCIFDTYIEATRGLRIYKEDGRIYLNTGGEKKMLLQTIQTLTRVGEDVIVSHPGNFLPGTSLYNRKNEFDSVIQYTGKLPGEEYASIKVPVLNYKSPFCELIYNAIQHRDNIKYAYGWNMVKSLNLNNDQYIQDLFDIISVAKCITDKPTIIEKSVEGKFSNIIWEQNTKIITKNYPVIRKEDRFYKEIVYQNIGEFTILNRKNMNVSNEIVRVFDINRNKYEGLSYRDSKYLLDFLNNNIINVHLLRTLNKEEMDFIFSNFTRINLDNIT